MLHSPAAITLTYLFLFHTIHTDGVIYLNRLKPHLFITLLSSAYLLKLFSECKREDQILGTEGTQDSAAEAGNCSWWKSERNLHRSQTAFDWLNVSSGRHTSQCYLEDNDYIPQEFLPHCFFLFICLLFPPSSFSKWSISKTENWIFLLPWVLAAQETELGCSGTSSISFIQVGWLFNSTMPFWLRKGIGIWLFHIPDHYTG